MKVVLVLLALLASCWAQSCDNSFKDFLYALKDELVANSRPIETEFKNDYYTLARKCFADSSSGSNCYLGDDELNGDVYGDRGPMKGCNRCQGLARSLRDKFMKSKESVRKCLRLKFSQAVREEIEPCIQGKVSNGYDFHVPQLPDFDEKTFESIDIVEAGINYRIMARSRLDACANVNPGKYGPTKQCMDAGYSGIYSKHCSAVKKAKRQVSSSCGGRFTELKGAVCQCFDEKRLEWQNKFKRIKAIVDATANGGSASKCANDINSVLGSWLGKIESAMNECIPKDNNGQGQKNLRTLIELGCGQVANGGVSKNELTVGFRFVRLFLDALNDRITVFCDKKCDS